MKQLFTGLLLTFLIPAFGQRATSFYSSADTGKIVIDQPEEVAALIDRHKQYMNKMEEMPGYRVQIKTSSTLKEIQKAQLDFNKNFEDIHAYIIYAEPNYLLKVGDYKTRLQAYHDLMMIRKIYPQAFISRGNIRIKAL